MASQHGIRRGPKEGFTLVLFVLTACCSQLVQTVDVPEYFPEIGEDLGAVTWAHAVNSKALLEESINGDVMMLEADVVLGWVGLPGGLDERIPVMAHPPAVTSDLSLHDFLAGVLEATGGGARKGIKLDFKSLAVLEPSLQELEAINDQITFPVWLNADILRGPVNSTGTPVEATSFLSQCKQRFPGSTLSTGWTTRFGPQTGGNNITEGSYTPQQVDEMTSTVAAAELSQPVTFPVRAGIAAHSGPELGRLLAGTPNSTLTLWGSASDPVDVEALRAVLDTVGRNHVYIDVPEDLREALNSAPVMAAAALPTLAVLSALALHALR